MKNYIFTLANSGSSPTSLELTHSPVGWNDKTITFIRNKTYHSVMRSYSLALKFIREGKDYIDAAYSSDGINALITIAVTKLDKSDYIYKAFYTGILDLSKLVQRRNDSECPIIDSDRMSKLKSRDEIELSLNTLKTLDGVIIVDFTNNLYKTLNITTVDIYQSVFVEFISPVITVSITNTSENATDGAIYKEIPWDDTLERHTNDSGDIENVDYSIKSTISWDLNFPTGLKRAEMRVKLYISNSPYEYIVVEKIISETFPYPMGRSGTLSGEISGSEILAVSPAGYIGKAKLSVTAVSSGVTGTVTLNSGQLLITKIITGIPKSSTESLFPDETIQRLLELTTGEKAFRSSLVGRTDSENYTYSSDGSLSLVAILNGNNIRGFSQLLKPFKTSFKDLFKALYSIQPIGFWYSEANNRWELNQITDFYKDSGVFDLGEVKDLEISVDESYYFNTVKAGYTGKLEYENINGNQNFATETKYSNSVKRVKNEYDLSTNYRSDDYGIEIIRDKNWEEYYTEDVKGENDNFMIYSYRDSGDFTSYKGIDNFETVTAKITGTQELFHKMETRLNLDLSPKRCMLRHRVMLEIPEWKTEADINFISSQFNFDLGLKKSTDSAIIYESDPIEFAVEPLYYPEIYNFTVKITDAIMTQLLTDPHILFSFTYLDNIYYGHILEISTEPFNRKGNCTLIRYNSNR